MKKIAALGILLATLAASPAHSQGGLSLAWSDCASNGGGMGISFACNINSGALFYLYGAAVLPVRLRHLTGVNVEVGVALDAVTIPPWWQAGPGSCRANAIQMTFSPGYLNTACADIWTGNSPRETLEVRTPTHAPFAYSLVGDAQLPAGTEVDYPANGEEVTLFRIMIARAKTVGPGACAGCMTGAMFVFERCTFRQSGTQPQIVISEPYHPDRAYPRFNGGLPVPAVNRTWGTIKRLYR